MERVVGPTNYNDLSNLQVLFLNGPIQGAPDWQKEAITIIHDLDCLKSIWIANPRRDYLPGTFIPEEQYRWERVHREIARNKGVNLFWLAKEVSHHPERAYAQATRFELAESLGWYLKRSLKYPSKMVLGVEKGFSGERYIKFAIDEDYSNDYDRIQAHSSLEETCKAAVDEIIQMVED